MLPAIPVLTVSVPSFLAIGYYYFTKRRGKIQRRKLESMRYLYKKALEGKDQDTALSLGIEYYAAVNGGMITDVDRKRVEYAVSLMKKK